MVVKVRGQGLPKQYLYSAAGGGLVLLSVGYVASTALFGSPVTSCETRYLKAAEFAQARRNGQLITPSELQAGLGGNDWGVLENARVMKIASGPAPTALKITFNAGGSDGGKVGNAVSGLGFNWTPSFLQSAKTACLAYDVLLPEDFDFGSGGTLPGLFGGDPAVETVDGKRAYFATPLRWLPGGKMELRSQTYDMPASGSTVINKNWLTLPRGRWFRLEQDVTLNTPGYADGSVRVFVDGKLQGEVANLGFRKDDAIGFSGIVANTHYGSLTEGWRPAPAASEIKLSPFVVYWK